MISLLALVIWSSVGAAAAVWFAEPAEPRTSWVPYGLILGPLWFCVVQDRSPDLVPDGASIFVERELR